MDMFPFVKRFLALRHNQFLSREAIQRMQQEKLTALLRHAYLRSPYYHKVFEQAGINYDLIGTLPLSAYPTIDKQMLIAAYDELVTVDELRQVDLAAFDQAEDMEQKLYMGKYHVVHSSGSTGLPRYFVYDEAAWAQMLSGIVRGALWGMSLPRIAALLLSRPRILYIAATGGRYGGAMAVGDGIDGVGAQQRFLDINTPLSKWVSCIESFRPQIVIGYPSAIKIMAGMAVKGEIHPRVKRIVSCGEPLAPGMRRYIENALQAEVVNFYGSSESLAMGVEGAKEQDMALFDDLNVIEVVNGEMYLTCLYNFTQPLIRYRLSDQLMLREDVNGAFSRAEIVLSRNEDVLWFENKSHRRDFLHPLAVEGFCLNGLTDYQFIQDSGDHFTMIAVAAPLEQDAIREAMNRHMGLLLKDKQLDWVGFDIRFVNEIRPNKHTGKKQLIVCPAA